MWCTPNSHPYMCCEFHAGGFGFCYSYAVVECLSKFLPTIAILQCTGRFSHSRAVCAAQVKRMQAAGGASAKACAAFLQQMGYREYARYLSYHFPFTHERSLLEHLRAAPWRFDQGLFKVGIQDSGGQSFVHGRLLLAYPRTSALALLCGRAQGGGILQRECVFNSITWQLTGVKVAVRSA